MTEPDLAELRLRVAVLEEQMRTVNHLVATFGPTARQVLEATLGLKEHERRIAELRDEITRAADQLHSSLRRAEQRLEKDIDVVSGRVEAQRGARITARGTVIAAIWAALGIVAVAVIERL